MIPRPIDELSRLEALHAYQLLDTPVDDDFSLLTELAAALCDAPYSFVSLVDGDRVWYKSTYGIQTVQAPRDDSYCSWAILEQTELVITDVRADARTANMAITAQDPPYRMYAGVNLTTCDGYRVGVLCVADTQPRDMTERQLGLLRRLARQVITLMELRRVDRELKTALTDVTRLANEDELTGLKNRRAWLEVARHQLQMSKRLGTPMSILMLDVDHFKSVNDTHGHPMGDAVLRSLGKLLTLCLRETDTPGRMGGEEFAVLIPGTDAMGAARIAETLRNAVALESIQDGAVELQVTVSIGVVSVQNPAKDLALDTLMRTADQALYTAKQTGRNRVVMADGIRAYVGSDREPETE